jgi:methylglyoxal reductase
MEAYRSAGALDSDQEIYSMLDRGHEKAALPYCAANRLAFLAYSSLAQGLLTGKIGPNRKFEKGDQRNNRPRFSVDNRKRIVDMLAGTQPIANRYQVTTGQLVVAWTLAQPGCTHALVGARTPEQVTENARGGDVVLAPDDVAAITRILESAGKLA